MTKEVKETKVRFYKKTSFPWAIVVVAVVFFSGLLTGWAMRTDQESQMDAVRATAVAEVSKTSQK